MVDYNIEKQGSMSLITCSVNQEPANPLPQWLHMKKFEVKTMLSGRSYSMIYDDRNHDANLDTSMFIEKTYSAIMLREKMVVVK